ncbi:MAG: recombinase RecA, partial [Methylovirgula sp.]
AAHLQAVQEKIAAGEWAQSVLAGNWAGYGVGEVLGIDPDDEGGRERLKTLLRSWIKSGALSVQRKHDKMKGRDKPMIVVGAPA